jgi:hypothetical protein
MSGVCRVHYHGSFPLDMGRVPHDPVNYLSILTGSPRLATERTPKAKGTSMSNLQTMPRFAVGDRIELRGVHLFVTEIGAGRIVLETTRPDDGSDTGMAILMELVGQMRNDQLEALSQVASLRQKAVKDSQGLAE